jgi:hypothetical protein
MMVKRMTGAKSQILRVRRKNEQGTANTDSASSSGPTEERVAGFLGG